MIFNMVGGGSNAASAFPEFTYTGTYNLIDDGFDEENKVQNWRIKFLTSGTLVFSKVVDQIDAFLVGGGGNGGNGEGKRGKSGGGGGYTQTVEKVLVSKGTEYEIVVGGAGGRSSAFNYFANGGAHGGTGTNIYYGVQGGSGSGAGTGSDEGGTGGAGGTNGGNGGNSNAAPGGTGQGVTTCEFGDPSATRYSGGGGGGSRYGGGAGGEGGGGAGGGPYYPSAGRNGTTNLGGGGGGGVGDGGSGGAGGSGIVIIRNCRTA